MKEERQIILTDNVRIVSISGQAGLGKSTLAQDLRDYCEDCLAASDSRVKVHVMSIMASSICRKMCELFDIDVGEYKAKKHILRPFLEDYGVMERMICGEDNAINTTLIAMNIMFDPIAGEPDDKAVIIIDDVRFLNQGMRLAAHPDTLSVQLIQSVPVPQESLRKTEQELRLFQENIPSLRTFVAKMPATIPTIKAVVRSWMEKDSMKEWLST